MLDLTTQYNYTSTGDGGGGFVTSGYTGYRVVNGNEYCEVLLNVDGVSQLSRMSFYGLDVTDSNQFVQQAVDNIGRYGETHQDWTNMTSYRVIPAQILTETNGGPLLTLANTYKEKYFGGVTQTAASLKAYLDRMYGSHNGYAYVQFSGGDLIITTRLGDITGINAPINYVSDWAGGTIAPAEYLSITGNMYTLPSDVATLSDAEAALIFGERVLPNTLQFDVYIDGTKDPNMSIRWNGDVNDDFSLQLVTPRVWTLPDSQPSYPYVNEGGILVPNEANPRMRTYVYTFGGQYDAPYLTEFNNCTSDLDAFTKTTLYGATGIATRMRYLLRFNKQKNENNMGVMTWGNCYIVDIPREVASLHDITVTKLDPSTNNPEFVDNVVLHLGAPPDDIPDEDDEYPDGTDSTGTDPGVYDPDVPPHDFTTGESSGFSGKAILTRTYAMTALVTQNVGSKLWSQSYFDVLKIQNNPIENIVSVKWFPFSVTGPTGSVKVGDVDFQINADVVDSIYKFTLGSVRYDATDKSNPSFLDMSPFTTLKLHLPYCGIVQLDATEMLNRKITVKYTVDLVSGDCMAFIYLDDNIPYMNVAGHCGVDIPLTSTNRIQAEMRAASTTISAVTGAAAHMVSGDLAGAAMDAAQGALSIGGMDYTSQRTSSHSPACTSTGNRACYLEIFKPAYKESAGFKSRHGYPCHLYKKLGSFKGFVKCDTRTKIDFAMTRRENEMLEQLLTSGVYV